jgi:hypothetical protein
MRVATSGGGVAGDWPRRTTMRFRRPAASGVEGLFFLIAIGIAGMAAAGALFAAGFALLLPPGAVSAAHPAPAAPVRTAAASLPPNVVRPAPAVAAAAPGPAIRAEVAEAPPVVARKAAAAPPSVPAPANRPVAAAVLALGQGDARFAAGEVEAARYYYERALDAGDAEGAVRLGETFDPAFLIEGRLRRVRPDPAAARSWYRRAAALGAAAAHQRLAYLDAEPAAADALGAAPSSTIERAAAAARPDSRRTYPSAAPTFHELLERILHPPRN